MAIRELNDVVVMDMCNGEFMETTLQMHKRSFLPLREGFEITEGNHGKRFTVSIIYAISNSVLSTLCVSFS